MRVYLDNAATTKVSEKVVRVMNLHFQSEYGNPSSIHRMGIDEKHFVETSREKIGSILHCDPSRILFTSGATEANNTAIYHYYKTSKNAGKNHIVLTGIEHSSVYKYCEYLAEAHGVETTVVNADYRGVVDPYAISRAIREDTFLVCAMAVNNETGTIQNITHLASVCKRKNVPLHMDVTQAVGHTHINLSVFDDIDCSFSFSGHKFHGPKGTGCLIKPTGRMTPLFFGGDQESYNRAGTENVPGIVGMSTALEEGFQNGFWESQIKEIKKHFIKTLQQKVGGVLLNGDPVKSIPGILNVSFAGVKGNVLVSMLSDLHGVFCSTGSSCNGKSSSPSRVLKAMGMTDDRALTAVRFSFSRYTTIEEIDYTMEALCECMMRLRGWIKSL